MEGILQGNVLNRLRTCCDPPSTLKPLEDFMSYNLDFVEARAEDIFEDLVKRFFVDLTTHDEVALYSVALDQAIEEAL